MLRLLLLRAPSRLAIAAQGNLDAVTAHLLPKAVIGALRAFPTEVLAIDLTEVNHIDYVGEVALSDCRREAERRGIVFALIGFADPELSNQDKYVQRRGAWIRSFPTGTICPPTTRR